MEVDVQIEASSVYEILMSLLVFGRIEDADTYDIGLAWFEQASRRVTQRLLKALHSLSPQPWFWLRILGVASSLPSPKLPDRFLADLAAYRADALHSQVLGGYPGAHQVTRVVIEKARTGDQEARARIAAALSLDDARSRASLNRVIAVPPERFQRMLVDIVSGWYEEVFRHEEGRVIPVLASEARAKRALGRTSPERLIRFATGGIDYTPGRRIRKILLIPSLIIRPWAMATIHRRTAIFCYPADDDEAPRHPEAPPARLIQIHRALADENRLRILRQLGKHESTLEDLSRSLAHPLPQIRSHLALLRAARLVDLDLEHNVSRIHPDVASTVHRALKAYLEGSNIPRTAS